VLYVGDSGDEGDGCRTRRSSLFTTTNFYTPPQDVVLARWWLDCAKGYYLDLYGGSMQDPVYEVRRIHLPRTPVNRVLLCGS
jgi:hypothetical protein